MAKYTDVHSLSAAVERIAYLLRTHIPRETKKNHTAEVLTSSNKIQQIAKILRAEAHNTYKSNKK